MTFETQRNSWSIVKFQTSNCGKKNEAKTADCGRAQYTSHLQVLKQYLTSPQITIVYQRLITQFPEMISSRSELERLMRGVNSEQKTILYEAMKNVLCGLIHDFSDLIEVLAFLTPEQATLLLEKLSEQLPALIKTADELRALLRELIPSQCALVCQSLNGRSEIFTTHPREIVEVSYLCSEKFLMIFEAFKPNLITLLAKDPTYFQLICNQIHTDQKDRIIQLAEENWLKIIPTLNHLTIMLKALSLSQQDTLLRALDKNLPHFIESFDDYHTLRYSLDPTHRVPFFETTKQHLATLPLDNDSDRWGFSRVLGDLNEDQSIFFVTSLQPKLLKLKKLHEYTSLYRYESNLIKKDLVFQATKENIPPLITSLEDFTSIMALLDAKNRSELFSLTQNTLAQFILNAQDISTMLSILNRKDQLVFFQSITSNLSSHVNSTEDFIAIMQSINAPQQDEFIKLVKPKLPGFMKCSHDLAMMIQVLPLNDATLLFQEIQSRLPVMQSRSDFMSIMGSLEPKQKSIFFDSVKASLLELIRDGSDFKNIMNCLDSGQQTVFFEMAKDRLATILENGHDFKMIIECLEPEKQMAFIELAKDRLPSLMYQAYSLANLMPNVSFEQRARIFQIINPRLQQLIHSANDFQVMLSVMRPEERMMFFEALSESLASRIQQPAERMKLLFNNMSPEEAAIVFESFIKTIEDVDRFVTHQCTSGFIDDAYERFMRLLMPKLPKLINTARDFQLITSNMDNAYSKAVFDAIKTKLPEMMNTWDDFQCFLSFKENERQRREPFLLSFLPTVLTTLAELYELRTRLSEQEFPVYFKALPEAFFKQSPPLVQTLSDFYVLRACVPSQNVVALCKEHLERLSPEIKTANDLYGLLSQITPEERLIVMAMVKKSDFPIEIFDELHFVLQMLPVDVCASMLTPRVLKAFAQCSYAPLELLKNESHERILEHYEELCQLMETARLDELYFKAVGVIMDQSRHQFLESSRRESSPQEGILEDILNDAKTHNGRSRQACVELGWIHHNGGLNVCAPIRVRQAYQARPAPDASSIDKTPQ